MPRAELRRAMRERVALTVAESEARHRALLAALPGGVVLHDTDGSVLLANPAATGMLGLTPAELGVPAQRGARNPALAELARIALRAIEDGRQDDVELAGTGLRVTALPLTADDGRAQAVVSTLTDGGAEVHDRGEGVAGEGVAGEGVPAAEEVPATPPGGMPLPEPSAPPSDAERRQMDMFRQSMQHSPIGFGVAALNGRFLRVNRRLCRMLGYRADELQERTLYQVLHPEDLEETSVEIGRLLRSDVDAVALERRYVGHGGMQLFGMLSISLVRDEQGRPLQFVVQIADISEIHRAQHLLTHMTLHDHLTGLPNRTLVLDRISQALDRSQRSRRGVAVLLCDVDHFRIINDSAGHDLGDAVLVEIGRRIARALRAGDTAGRLGGDEFVVVCEDVADESDAVQVAERVRQAVTAPVAVADREVTPTVSIGIAVASTSDIDPVTLLRDADIARYRAKERGRDRWDLVDAGMREEATGRLDVEHALRAGVEAGDLRLHFQPIVDLTTRALVGREALVRWEHPERGLLAPALFLPVAEQSGLIAEIGRWVLTEAARAAAASPSSTGYVSVNVSPNQLIRPGLADGVAAALAHAGLPAHRLIVELTESVVLSGAPAARRELHALDEQGVRVVVDDFGTGFSALSYLRDLPVSGIKVDRSFTAGLGGDGQCERIVQALTGLGAGLGVDVVVEGVETEQQRELLAGLGAEHAQGYLFGRPSPEFTPV